ncbi:MAG: hypothetical protein P1V20_27630, partial [Verrucomicrobiales bacterium]|nr:hypothetical protein [Verrucomicrobiales bacterium]
ISPSEYFVIVKKSNKKTIEVLLPEATVVDSDGNDNRESNLLLVDFDPNLNLQLDPEVFRLSLTSGVPQPIPLEPGQFVNPVVFATVQHDDPTIPMHAQVSDVSSSEFTVTVQRLDGLKDPVSDVMVHTVILETGTYNNKSTGIKMEVGTTLVNNVSGKINGYSGGKTVQLLKNYNDAVVIGQVQTANSSNPGEFWSRLDDQGFLTVGHHVGELPSPLNDGEETVAYAVVEAGKGVFEDTRWEAANFTTDSSGATVDVIRNINSSVNIVVSQHDMVDPDGSIPVIESTTRDTLTVRLLEDKLGDSEMDHGEEKAGFLLIKQ